MKAEIAILFAITLASCAELVLLKWDYPAEFRRPDDTFRVHHSSDLSIPLRLWPVLYTVQWDWTNLIFDIPRGRPHYFCMSVSNSGGMEMSGAIKNPRRENREGND